MGNTTIHRAYTEEDVFISLTDGYCSDTFKHFPSGNTCEQFAGAYTLDVKNFGDYTVGWMKLEQTCCRIHNPHDCYWAEYRQGTDVDNVHDYHWYGSPWVGAWKVALDIGISMDNWYVCDHNVMSIRSKDGISDSTVSVEFDERKVESIEAWGTASHPSLVVYYEEEVHDEWWV